MVWCGATKMKHLVLLLGSISIGTTSSYTHVAMLEHPAHAVIEPGCGFDDSIKDWQSRR